MDESVVFWNSHSLLSNLSEFKVFLYGLKPAVAFISETWLRKNMSVTFINYRQARLDRNVRIGGGIIFLVRSDITYDCLPLNVYPNGTLEILAIRVHIDKSQYIIIGLYNPTSALFSSPEFIHFVDQVDQ